MRSNQELLKSAAGDAGEAAAILSDLKEKTILSREEISRVVLLLRLAHGATLSLESRLAGNPPPKEG